MFSRSTQHFDSNDARLIHGLRAGDFALFEELYHAWFHDLAKYGASFLSDDEAGDLVQDVFLAIWHQRDQLSVASDRELFAYLLRSVRNRALDVRRHERIGENHRVSLALDTESSQSSDSEVLDQIAQKDLLDHVRALIETLPSRSREVLILRWYHGLSFEQIASIMGISYGSAHVLHSRALAMVRREFGES